MPAKQQAAKKTKPAPAIDPNMPVPVLLTPKELYIVEQAIANNVVHAEAKPILEKIEKAAQAAIKNLGAKTPGK